MIQKPKSIRLKDSKEDPERGGRILLVELGRRPNEGKGKWGKKRKMREEEIE